MEEECVKPHQCAGMSQITAIIPENVVQFYHSLTEIFLRLSPAVFVLGSSPCLSFIALLVTLFFHLRNAQCLVNFFFAATPK